MSEMVELPKAIREYVDALANLHAAQRSGYANGIVEAQAKNTEAAFQRLEDLCARLDVTFDAALEADK